MKETRIFSIVFAVQIICILQARATNVNETYRYEKTPIKETCLLLIIFAVQIICILQERATKINETYRYKTIKETCILSVVRAVQIIHFLQASATNDNCNANKQKKLVLKKRDVYLMRESCT